MTRFRPWKIQHIDLSQTLPGLPLETGIGGLFLVLWWNRLPLGHDWIPANRLPMSDADLRELALKIIAPAVEAYLSGSTQHAPRKSDTVEKCSMDFDALARLKDPLAVISGQLSLTTHECGDTSVSVVICTRDRPRQLRRCLSSLKCLSRHPLEIGVVDNAPRSDATCRVVSEFPGIKYIHEPRPGLDVARNTGIRHTEGNIVAFTDDDAAVHPDWIARIQDSFQDPQVMAVTGLVLPSQLKTISQVLFERHWGFGRGYAPKVFSRSFFEETKSHGVPAWEIGAGANMAFRREAFEQVGLFDERLDVGAAGCSGDSEMWYRILAKGWACRYTPTSVVYHDHRRNIEDLHRQIYYYMRGHVAALLVQFERHHHWGNIRRLLISLPRYYAGLAVEGLLGGRLRDRHETLPTEIRGCLSGIRFYLSKRRARPIESAEIKQCFGQGTGPDT